MQPTILPLIRAWCRHYGCPDPGEPDEQMRFPWNEEFYRWLDEHTVDKDWEKVTADTTWFRRDPLPIHPVHQWPGAHRRESRRETCYTYAMQVVLFYAGENGLGMQIDFDEENPDGGLLPAVGHFFRMIARRFFGGETKPEAVAKVLEARGIIAAKEAA